jgi:hypothetical protein
MVVGGSLCRYASHFVADAHPSPILLKHRAMSVSLIYEFGISHYVPSAALKERGAHDFKGRR